MLSLENYLHAYLGSLASQLGYSVGTSYTFIISETLAAYGVESEVLATDTKKLHALGKVELWKAVLRDVSFDYDFSADGSSSKRSQLFDHVQNQLAQCMIDALPYMDNYQIETGTLENHDPYTFREEWIYAPYNYD